MEVRPATAADAPVIAEIHVRAWQTAYRGLLPQSYLDDLDPVANLDHWQTVLGATRWPSTGTLVLVDPTTVLGFAVLSPTRDDDDDPAAVGELQNLYLHPRSWRRGGGSTLLRATAEQFVRAGFTSASAWVLETNSGARRFYEQQGWHGDGTSKPHDWGSFVVTDVRYRRSLP